LEYHNTGKSNYTSKASDWELVYCIGFETKYDALMEEKRLKKLNKSSLEKIVSKYLSERQ
jgi:putative endonuclease